MSDTAEALARALMQKPDFQLGLDAGYGRNAARDPSDSSTYKTDTGEVLRAYALARNPLLGVEAGYMKLPTFHARFATGDYPAYKKAASGLDVSYPQTAAVSQDISASAPYARLNLYGPKVMGAEPYGFYGRALMRADNHEHALYNGRDVNDYREVLKKNAPYYGLGLEAPLTKNVNLRAEYGRIPHAVDEYHTGDRDISMGLLGLGVKW